MDLAAPDPTGQDPVILALLLSGYFYYYCCAAPRAVKTRRQYQREPRLDVYQYVCSDRYQPHLEEELRMSLQSFLLLCSVLEEPLKRNSAMGDLRGGYVTPMACVYLAVRWLAGGRPIDIANLLKISKVTFYQLLWPTLDAIISSKNPHLNNIHFPKTFEACEEAARGFQRVSFRSAISNCVTAIDGLLLKVRVPTSGAVGNVRSFFSGHYKRYGVNIQAAVDSKCRFQFIGLAGPGCMGDRDASRVCGLLALIRNLPAPFVAIGDAGYTAFEQLATIYNAYNARDPKKDNFNYYASQLRIRVEMAFALLTQKWIIFEAPLKCHPLKWKKIVLSAARLHNFCINQRGGEDVLAGVDRRELRRRFVPSQPQRGDGTPIFSPDDLELYDSGSSIRRDIMVREIARMGLVRPKRSVGRASLGRVRPLN